MKFPTSIYKPTCIFLERRKYISFLLLCLITFTGFAQTNVNTLKAVYLEKFSRFVTWPEECMMNDINQPFIISIIVLISKYTKYNKLLASILCFYWAINSFLLEDIIDKLKIASHNLLWAAEETGTYPLNPNMATNVARMDIINEGAIIIFTFIGIFLLILHIFRKKEEKTELPPEAPSPRTIF